MVSTPPRKSKVPNILGDWDDVRFFLAVAKTGSFSAAATQLNTKQTTVGRRIQALERRLGAKLFDRHRHGMEVTPAARGVLVQAESMMSNATSIERHLAGLDREMAGVVRIASTEGIAAHWLVPRLGQLRRSHPDIIVQVIAGDQVLDLATRQADLAIRFFRPTSNQLVAARVGQFNMSIFAAPNYIEQYGLPQKLEDMREHHIVDHTMLHSLPAMKPWSEVVERSPSVVLAHQLLLRRDRGGEGRLRHLGVPRLRDQVDEPGGGTDRPQDRPRHLAGQPRGDEQGRPHPHGDRLCARAVPPGRARVVQHPRQPRQSGRRLI